jgi:hypothetical protein
MKIPCEILAPVGERQSSRGRAVNDAGSLLRRPRTDGGEGMVGYSWEGITRTTFGLVICDRFLEVSTIYLSQRRPSSTSAYQNPLS